MPKDQTPDADVTVTSATQSVAEVQRDLGIVEPPAPVDAAIPAAVAAVPDADPDLEQEADSDRPDTQLSDAGRALRANRLDTRVRKLKDDITLYEDTIRSAGGTPKAPEVRLYANPQAELDHLTRIKHDRMEEVNKALRAKPLVAAAPPVAVAPPPAAAPVAPLAAAPPVKTFTFETFEQWQEQHPDGDFVGYTMALNTAQWGFFQKQADDDRHQKAEAARYSEGLTKAQASVASYKATHPDYEAHVSTLRWDPESPQVRDLHGLLIDHPEDAPAVLDYLGTHPEAVAQILTANAQSKLYMAFASIQTEVRLAAKAASISGGTPPAAVVPSAPAPVAAAAPVTDAPAPATQVKGGAAHTRTLQQIADDGEDADAYIAARQPPKRQRAG